MSKFGAAYGDASGVVKSRTDNGNAAERGVDIMAANQSLIESRAMRHEKNCSELIIIVDTICAMTANAVIFTIVNKFPKNGKIFTILKILFRAAKRARPRGDGRVEYHNIIRIQKLKRVVAFC